MVRWLVKNAKMPIMDTTKAGATPLHYASAKGCLDCVKILVESCPETGWVKFGSISSVDTSDYLFRVVSFCWPCLLIAGDKLGDKKCRRLAHASKEMRGDVT